MPSTTIWTFEPTDEQLHFPVDFPVKYGDRNEVATGRAFEMLEDGIRFVGDKPFSVGKEIELQFPDQWFQLGKTVTWRAVVCESCQGSMRVEVIDPTEADRLRTLEALHREVLLRYH